MSDKDIKATRGGIAIDNAGIANRSTFNINQVARYGSLLNPLLEKIIDKYDPDSAVSNNDEIPDPEEKLEFNHVSVFSEEIVDCVGFLSLVEEQVDTIDDDSPGAKKKFLRAIHQNYKNHKCELLIENEINSKDKAAVIKIVRANADLLIQRVTNTILEYARVDLYYCPVEDVRDSINLILCYGFINCKVLERPDDYC
jgi:hypothetical protein